MEATGIAGLAGKPIGHLSGGELQKVSFARVLAQQPRLLLLDEPTSNLDPKAQGEILRLVESIFAEKKYTILFVTHILSHIPGCCDRVVLMKNGTVMHEGDAGTMLSGELLSSLYECPVETGILNGKRHFHVGESHP
jgi:ABC-type cobalamin/Fe3+-siderophores transport system ATPase subunit